MLHVWESLRWKSDALRHALSTDASHHHRAGDSPHTQRRAAPMQTLSAAHHLPRRLFNRLDGTTSSMGGGYGADTNFVPATNAKVARGAVVRRNYCRSRTCGRCSKASCQREWLDNSYPAPRRGASNNYSAGLTAIAMETRQGGDAKQGSVEDDSAAIAQNTPNPNNGEHQ